jgi:hypothetical protein
MRESRLSGSVRGATSDGRLYRDWESLKIPAISRSFLPSRFQKKLGGFLLPVGVDQPSDPRMTYELPAITYDG